MTPSDLYDLRRLHRDRQRRRDREDDYTGTREPTDREREGERRIAARNLGPDKG